MPTRGRIGLWVVGGLGCVVVAGAVFWLSTNGRPSPGPSAAVIDRATPLPQLTELIRQGDSRALAEMFQRSAVTPEFVTKPLSEAEAAQWVDGINALRSSFLQFNPYGRASAITVVGRVLQRLSIDPAPANWADALQPARDVITAGLNDTNVDVRVSALDEFGKLWSWTPGRALLAPEEDHLANWKQGIHGPVVRRLGDREPKSRMAAIQSLSQLPIDSAAAPAIAYLDDPKSPEVRKQVIVSFARRPSLLSEDALLKHSFDNEAGINELVAVVLKARGLTQEQVSLGSMIFHPKPDIRASVIPLLKNRTDIDPAVWLLKLSHDDSETVRLGAVDALAARMTPELGQRLAEMAAKDSSSAVRKAASKFLPEAEKTAALPPLPGSPSLNPKAN
ncbi:MAG: HEAT repeat domain-containing protein [Isosphaeraceae bacterium]